MMIEKRALIAAATSFMAWRKTWQGRAWLSTASRWPLRMLSISCRGTPPYVACHAYSSHAEQAHQGSSPSPLRRRPW